MKGLFVQRAKSWTYWLGLSVGVLGLIQANFPLISDFLGDKAGIVNMGIMVSIFVVRELTTKPLSDK